MTLRTIPPFVQLSCWRRQFIGLLGVSHPSEADVVQVTLPGMKTGLSVELNSEAARDQFWYMMDALAVAHELGRRDVIAAVRSIFADQPAGR